MGTHLITAHLEGESWTYRLPNDGPLYYYAWVPFSQSDI